MKFPKAGIFLLSLAFTPSGVAAPVDAAEQAAPAEAPTSSAPNPTPVLLSSLTGCTAETICSDGSVLQCEGAFGETCTENAEICTTLDGCSGSRNFVQCGTEKKVCPCVKDNPLCGKGCAAEVTCTDGTVISCKGKASGACTESSERCITADGGPGSRDYVECGTTKKECPCVAF